MEYNQVEEVLKSEGIIFLTYGGLITQTLVSGLANTLEIEAENNRMGTNLATKILTIFIEMSQNIMNYAQLPEFSSIKSNLKALIIVGYNESEHEYFIYSRNVLDNSSVDTVRQRLSEIEGLSRDELRQLYRERRRDMSNKHNKGAGIGFIEIARRSDQLEYDFHQRTDGYTFFSIKATLKVVEDARE